MCACTEQKKRAAVRAQVGGMTGQVISQWSDVVALTFGQAPQLHCRWTCGCVGDRVSGGYLSLTGCLI